jgi:Holliday junction resolvase RusA-like endonuclease
MSDNDQSTISFTIYGEPASKSNSRRWTGKFLIKSEKALKYGVEFKKQCPVMSPLMTGDLRVTIKIYYASRRPDLDPSLIFDLMQDCIYSNDRQVREQHLYWGLDKEKPRSEITVEKINE